MIELFFFSRNIFLVEGVKKVVSRINKNLIHSRNIKMFILDDKKLFDNLIEIRKIVNSDDHVVIVSGVMSSEIARIILRDVNRLYLMDVKLPINEFSKLVFDFSKNGISDNNSRFTARKSLSANDREVFFRICNGESPVMIARTLKISVKKVSYHKINVLLSLGMSGPFVLALLQNPTVIQDIFSFL